MIRVSEHTRRLLGGAGWLPIAVALACTFACRGSGDGHSDVGTQAPGADGGEVEALPQCGSPPLPPSDFNFFLSVPNGPREYSGPGEVTAIRSSSSGQVFFVRIDFEGRVDEWLEVGSSGTELPSFAVGQRVRVDLLRNVGGIVTQLVALVWDEEERLLLADYNWTDELLRDGTIRELLGFDIALVPGCELDSGCASSPSRFFEATLQIASTSLALDEQVPQEIEVAGVPVVVVWKGGREADGRPTGECADFIFGTSLSFTVMGGIEL